MSTNINYKTSFQVKVGAILSYLSIIINIITGIFYTPWMIKQIGKVWFIHFSNNFNWFFFYGFWTWRGCFKVFIRIHS